MKIVGYILMVLSIIGGIVLLISGIKEREYIMILVSVMAVIFGVCTSLAVVYAADVPVAYDNASFAKRNAVDNGKSIRRLMDDLKQANNEISILKKEIKNLKESINIENQEK